jgi:regulator of CtrA degradation
VAWPLQVGRTRRQSGPIRQRAFRVDMLRFELMASDDPEAPKGPRPGEILDFARSELFDRTFQEGMELVEETASYLDGDGRRESKLLSR